MTAAALPLTDHAWLLQPEVVTAFFDERARRNMAQVRASPAYFRSVLIIDKGAGATGPFAPAMDDWQRADFEAMDAAWVNVAGRGNGVAPPQLYSYLERGRGHSKTTDIGATVLWTLLSSSRKLRGVAASGSKEQAGFIRDGIDTLLRLNAWLADVIEVNKWEVKNLVTGSTLTILAATEETTYGHTPDFIIIDELTHWGSNEGFWTSLASAAAKRPGCVLQIIANAGNGRGKPLVEGADPFDLGGSWQWRVREVCRTSKSWYFNRLDGCVASWITEKALAEQRKILAPSAYARLWLNQWQVTGANALPMDDVAACVTLTAARDNGDGFDCCVAAIDLSQTKHYSAVVIFGINLQRRRVELATTRRWRPEDFPGKRISLRQIRTELWEMAQRFNVAGLAFDPFQAELLAEDLETGDDTHDPLPCYRQTFDIKQKNLMAKRLLSTLRERAVDLYPDPELLRDLGRMQIIEKQGKRLAIEAPEGDDVGHCDVGTAFIIGLPWALGTLESMLLGR